MSVHMREQLHQLKQQNLSENIRQQLQRSNKSQRQESYQQALVNLANRFDDAVIEALTLRFNLHAGQAKKLKFKKDRIKILKQHGIDYVSLDGYETAEILSLIRQAIIHEDGMVTEALDGAFHFWKHGFEMVQLDNNFELLAEDIQIHFEILIDALLDV
ncbi:MULTISPECIES: hypothetical protein [unclassified Acinetobacter]|uniref:hypothetical protein n=1 Tax=unclassified Acinetobacter TaxID=196816 RepID=UPI0035BA7605